MNFIRRKKLHIHSGRYSIKAQTEAEENCIQCVSNLPNGSCFTNISRSLRGNRAKIGNLVGNKITSGRDIQRDSLEVYTQSAIYRDVINTPVSRTKCLAPSSLTFIEVACRIPIIKSEIAFADTKGLSVSCSEICREACV